MLLRRLNDRGIEVFRQNLAACRLQPEMDISDWRKLLEDKKHTEIYPGSLEVEPKTFTWRREAAEYLHKLFQDVPSMDLELDAGVWSWLSLYYFDSVCPKGLSGRRVLADSSYLLYTGKNEMAQREKYRHFLFSSWNILRIFPEHNRIWLDSSVSTLTAIFNEVFKRLVFLRIPCMGEVIEKLYWDSATGKLRPDIINTNKTKIRKGDLTTRLPACLRQLELTYDLQILSADALITLLGEEFLPENIGK